MVTIRNVLPATIELGEKFVSLFKALKKQFWGDDAAACEKLVEVIDEIKKFYQAMHTEILNFISMDFSIRANDPQYRMAMASIMSGSLQVRVKDAKGSCGRIKRIYEKNLDKWLFEKIQSNKYREFKNLFFSLSVYDNDMLEAASNLELEFIEKSKQLLGLLDKKQLNEAIKLQHEINLKYQPELSKLNHVMSELLSLRNELMEVTGSD